MPRPISKEALKRALLQLQDENDHLRNAVRSAERKASQGEEMGHLGALTTMVSIGNDLRKALNFLSPVDVRVRRTKTGIAVKVS